jgi:transcriptional regulator with XRE-family HTH domain
MSVDDVLSQVGPRLKRLRAQRGITLTELAAVTGISTSTLSRLETGQRRPSLELLLPLAEAYQTPLDELVNAPAVGDPRIRPVPIRRNGMTILPLTNQPGGLRATKMIIPPRPGGPDPQAHEGYEWLYVLSGKLRLVLAEHDLTLKPGEAAEFDTRLPHWFASAGDEPAEVLCLFGRQGEQVHVRARPRAKTGA